jgi:hypothetical protein
MLVFELEIEPPEIQDIEYVSLTTHADQFGSNPVKMNWGHANPVERGKLGIHFHLVMQVF